MASLAQFAGWLATQVFDVVGSVAGLPAADGGGAYSDTVDLQVGKTVYHDVPASVSAGMGIDRLLGAREQLAALQSAQGNPVQHLGCPRRARPVPCRAPSPPLPACPRADAHGAVAQPAAA